MGKRGVILRCAYTDCKKTTDKRSFGRIHALTPDQLSSYSTWLKSPHDGVVCDSHYTSMRRLLEKQQQAATEAEARTRMESLMAAAAMADSSSSSVESSPSVSPVLPPPTVLVTITEPSRSSSVPVSSSLSTAPSAGTAAPQSLRRSASMPLLRTGHRGCTADQRMQIAFTCVMSGVTWTTWNRLESNLNSQSMSKATWYRLTKKVWKAIEAVRDDRETAYIQQLLTANQPIVVVADGAWSHRGFTAGQHNWVLLNSADSKAILSIPLHRSRTHKGKVVHQGNYDDGSSKGMEGYALDIAIKKLQSSGLAALITGWVGDQDSSVLKQLRACPAAEKWEVHLDPNHAKKNLVSALQSIHMFGKRKEFKGLDLRIGAFIMRCTKRAEKEHADDVAGMRTQFLRWLDCVVPHYTRTCGADCPHHQQDDIESQVGQSNSASTSNFNPKTYLHPDIHGTEIAKLQAIINRMKQTTRYLIHGYNTCNAERFHRERLKFTPKELEFWNTWAPRCALNQLIHNYGYAETHRLVLAKLKELYSDSSSWAAGILPGNQYVAAMDSERAWHSARKSEPEYNRRQDQLARDFGKRRAAHDRVSEGRGHDYQHSPPLYCSGDEGEAVQPQQRKPRRTKAQIEKDNKEQKEKEDSLKALFDAGDTTFKTLGVIDTNVSVEESQRGRKKKRGKGEHREGKRDDGGKEVKKKRRAKENAGQHSDATKEKRVKRKIDLEERHPNISAQHNTAAAAAVTDVARHTLSSIGLTTPPQSSLSQTPNLSKKKKTTHTVRDMR